MDVLYGNIKRKREELGMTQGELAKKMGYKSRSSINKIELGKNDLPQSKIKEFAVALETTVSELMGWDAEDPKKKMVTIYPAAYGGGMPPFEASEEALKALEELAEFKRKHGITPKAAAALERLDEYLRKRDGP